MGGDARYEEDKEEEGGLQIKMQRSLGPDEASPSLQLVDELEKFLQSNKEHESHQESAAPRQQRK